MITKEHITELKNRRNDDIAKLVAKQRDIGSINFILENLGQLPNDNVWKIDPCFDKVHSAIFPVELCKHVIQYYSYKNDLIFDPFAGSVTVGKTAKALNRAFFLTEQEQKYVEYMKSKTKNQSLLFDERKTQFLTLEQFKKTTK